MNWLAIAGSLILAGGLGAGAPGTGSPAPVIAPAPVSPQVTSETIAMQTEASRRMTVPVTIMGEGPFHFLVDTGSQATALSRDLADRLDLTDRVPATLVAMASRRKVDTVVVPGFALGKQSATIRSAPLLERGHIGGADGILGLDVLQDQRVLLDFADKKIELVSTNQLDNSSHFDIVVRAHRKLGRLIITRARLNGVRVSLIVDTGAQASIGNLALLEQLRHRKGVGEAELTDVNGVQSTGAARIANDLDLGSARLSNFAIFFADSPAFAALGLEDKPALVLGMDQLRAFDRVAIDFPQRRILFSLPADSRQPSWQASRLFSARF